MKDTLSIFLLVLTLFLMVGCDQSDIITNDTTINNDLSNGATEHTVENTTVFTETTNITVTSPPETTEQPVDTSHIMPKSLKVEIEKAKEELRAKGWKNIDVMEGHHPYFNKWEYMADLAGVYDIGDNCTLYSVFGTTEIIPVYFETDSTISVIISIVYNNSTGSAQWIDSYYGSSYGIPLAGNSLRHRKNDGDIYYADDSDLQYYFHYPPTPHV